MDPPPKTNVCLNLLVFQVEVWCGWVLGIKLTKWNIARGNQSINQVYFRNNTNIQIDVIYRHDGPRVLSPSLEQSVQAERFSCNSSKFVLLVQLELVASLATTWYLISNMATRWWYLHQLQTWPFGTPLASITNWHQLAPLAFAWNLFIRLHHLHCPPGWVTCITTLPWRQDRQGPIDRTPGTPGSDEKYSRSWKTKY